MEGLNQPRKPKKVKAPEGCESYLTAGKEYDVNSVAGMTKHNGYELYVAISEDEEIYAVQFNTSHLNGKDWIVTEWEDENN